jgi:hypothetical protein
MAGQDVEVEAKFASTPAIQQAAACCAMQRRCSAPARAQSEIRPILDSFAESSAYIIHFRLAVRPNRMTQQQTEYNAVHVQSTYASPDWVHVLHVVGMQDEADLNQEAQLEKSADPLMRLSPMIDSDQRPAANNCDVGLHERESDIMINIFHGHGRCR